MHRSDIELRIIEQHHVDLRAELVEYQFGPPPTLAPFAASRRQSQHIGDGFADGVEHAPVLGRKGLSEILEEVRGGQRHGAYLSGASPRVQSTSHVLLSPPFEA